MTLITKELVWGRDSPLDGLFILKARDVTVVTARPPGGGKDPGIQAASQKVLIDGVMSVTDLLLWVLE